jgi:myo-inositol-1(or 4)-monophosphatase
LADSSTFVRFFTRTRYLLCHFFAITAAALINFPLGNSLANMNIMIKAARRAARSLMRDFGEVEHLQVSSKGPGDFVSRADIKAEEILKEELMEARPNYGWLAEEGEEIAGIDPTRRWIVDPLDGTTNYLHGLPHWAISIALEHKGEIVAAVIFNPTGEELFAAEKGAGAWLNDRRLRVSGRSEMIQMIFATGLPFGGRSDLPDSLQDLARILPGCAGVRRWGAAALDLAYVAAGRYDGFWERRLNTWDVAAGLLLVKEAGGFAESVTKGGNPLSDGSVIASNDLVFDRFAKLVRNG